MRSFFRIPARYLAISAAAAIVFFTALGRIFNAQELMFYDVHFQHRSSLPVGRDIVIIEIADDTLRALGHWPLPRDFHASLIDVLRSCGVRQIVFDLLFSEPADQDDVLASSMRRAGNVYLPQAFYVEGAKGSMLLAGIAPVLSGAPAGDGHINVLVDPDGKVRRIPLFLATGARQVPALGFKAACDVLGLSTERLTSGRRRVIVDGRLSLPVSDGIFLVNYPGPWKETFTHVSYVDILRSFKAIASGQRPPLDLTLLRDKTCFVGLTATGTSDLRANPVESVYPMVGLQASVFNSIMERRFIAQASPWINAALALFVFLLTLAGGLKMSPRLAFFASLLLAGAVFLVGHGCFVIGGFWLDFFWPLSVVAGTYVACLFYRFWKEAEQRKLLEKELSIARTIQDNFLPRSIPPFGGVRVSALMQPAKFVAGDLYDVMEAPEGRLGVLIGDVCGKGVPAALIMAQTVSIFRVFARQHPSPAQVMTAMNRELTPLLQGRFVTAIYLVIDTVSRTFTAAYAGHSPMIIYRSQGGSVEEFVADGGPPLGLEETMVYKDTAGECRKGDKILLFTDGITEARRGGEEYGLERLKDFLRESGLRNGEEVIGLLTSSVVKFQGSLPQHDDFTSLVIDFQ